MRHWRLTWCVLFWAMALAVVAHAGTVSLTWTAPTTNADGTPLTDLSGYYVHHGTSPGVYGQSTFVGLTTNAQVTNLSAGTYYFAVTASDTSGNVSDYSNEATSTVTSTSHELVLSPTQDTFINLDKITYGSEPTLHTYTWPDFKVGNAILMKFDLSSLPTTAVLESAVLSLWQVDSDASGGVYRVSVHQVIGKNPNLNESTGYRASTAAAWKANRCCYQRIPMAQANIGPVVDMQNLETQGGERHWTVTDLIAAWRAQPAQNFGLLLNADVTSPRDRWRSFASLEHPTAALHPALVITYALP